MPPNLTEMARKGLYRCTVVEDRCARETWLNRALWIAVIVLPGLLALAQQIERAGWFN
jgi:hypothetical protein